MNRQFFLLMMKNVHSWTSDAALTFVEWGGGVEAHDHEASDERKRWGHRIVKFIVESDVTATLYI